MKVDNLEEYIKERERVARKTALQEVLEFTSEYSIDLCENSQKFKSDIHSLIEQKLQALDK